MNASIKYLSIIVMLGLLVACGGKKTSHPQQVLKTYKVQLSTIHKTLHFTGTIQPLHESTLTSPAEGVLEKVHFHYGQSVHKGETIYTLNSVELQKQYNDTLTEYLKAKDNYGISKAKFTGTEELWAAGLLSKNNYLNEKSGLNTARITLIQASRKLSELLEKMGTETTPSFSKLSFAEFDKVRLELTSKHNLIYLKALNNGVLLYPPKSSEEKTTNIQVGSTIKTGQVLALIGDLTGISVNIDIPEIDLDTVKPGMPALVRGIAFDKDPLKGALVAVNAQASTSANGALPSFTAVVEVKSLNLAQQKRVKVGMSAAIVLMVETHDKLLVPIAAVKQVYGQSMVNVKSPDGHVSPRVVMTGEARADTVVIDSGLKVGDVLEY